VLEHDPCDETVAHADRRAARLERPPHPGGPIGSAGVQREGRDGAQELAESLELRWRPRSREELEAGHDGRLKRAMLEPNGNDTRGLALTGQEIDQDVGVGDRPGAEAPFGSSAQPVLLARWSRSGSAITLSRTSCAGSLTVISGLPR
jgi:hypothetical protein